MADGKVVFLCWSGTRSGKVAEALEAALPKLECGLKPFRSPEIAKGSLWFDQVREKLDAAQAAIVCLTPENAVGAWIHFEAGAIAAKMAAKSRAQVGPRVYPYLFRMSGVEVTGPLAQFQATTATEEDTLRLVRQLMSEADWEQWSPRAHDWWSAFENDLHRAEDRPFEEILPDLESLFRRKTFDEPLNECVNQSWPARWSGARDTHQRLKDKVAAVSLQCRPYARELLHQLVEAVDSYGMALELLLAPRSFDLKPDGKRDVPPGLLAACEQRRKDIKELISGLADPRQAPVFDDSPRFQAMESFSEKKAAVHQFEAWLAGAQRDKSKDWRLAQAVSSPAARTSRWDFDRVAFYLCSELEPPLFKIAVDWLRVELEKVRANSEASHMPLTYSLAPLQKAIAAPSPQQDGAGLVEEAHALLRDVCAIATEREKEQGNAEPSRVRVEAEKTLRLLAGKDSAGSPTAGAPATA